MTKQVETLTPPVGTKVRCFFVGNSYRGEVVGYGRKYPVVRFKLKNGKVKQGPATVVAHGAIPYEYRGYLAQLFAG